MDMLILRHIMLRCRYIYAAYMALPFGTRCYAARFFLRAARAAILFGYYIDYFLRYAFSPLRDARRAMMRYAPMLICCRSCRHATLIAADVSYAIMR